jgi:hypothetical protein
VRNVRCVGAIFVALATVGILAACTPKPTPAPTPVAHVATYQLHATYFSQASGLSVVIDPEMFEEAMGNPPGIGSEGISHAKDIRPVLANAAAGTALLSSRAAVLGITLGQWQKAAGTVTFTCVNGSEKATSRLTGLIPNAQYSAFVVHTDAAGTASYTPWGNSDGTNNNFSADADGIANSTDTVSGCLGKSDAIAIIWHSDGEPHGTTPGVLGVSAHDNLIAPLP